MMVVEEKGEKTRRGAGKVMAALKVEKEELDCAVSENINRT